MDFAALLAFLTALAQNNNKAWFDAHRATYEGLRGQFLGLLTRVLDGISLFDAQVGIVEPKDCLYRINRDIRFSPDKSPYKTYFSAAICPQGRRSNLPAYYFHITEKGEFLAAGGMYMPEPGQLALIRRHIAEEPARLAAVLQAPEFVATFGTLDGERLKRPPQGFDESTPYIEVIKLKSFSVGHELSGWQEKPDAAADELIGVFHDMYPFVGWLHEALAGWERQ
jgi:uncharacterized protein (TIGR02453 family)